MICPKCNIPYSDPKAVKCLLCGTVLVEGNIMATETTGIEPISTVAKPKKTKQPVLKVTHIEVSDNPKSVTLPVGKTTCVCEVTEISEEEFYKGRMKPQTAKQINIQQAGCAEEIVPPFDSKGGFSKRNGKQELVIEQLKADNEALRKRQADLENFEKEHHPEPKPWYASPANWIGLLCGLVLCYLVYYFVQSQGGMPAVYEFLRRIGF
jgi:hypothetical protein